MCQLPPPRARSVAIATRAHALGRAGDRDGALACLGSLPAGTPQSRFALALSGVEGRRDEAVAALQRASEERSRFVAMLTVLPAFDLLRDHPGFRVILDHVQPPRDA